MAWAEPTLSLVSAGCAQFVAAAAAAAGAPPLHLDEAVQPECCAVPPCTRHTEAGL